MSAKHHYHRIYQRVRGTSHAAPHAIGGALTPAQILTAYGFTQNQYANAQPLKLGIGSLGGGVVQQDIANSVTHWGMLAPNLTIRAVGGAQNNPADQGSNVENMLDIVPTMAFTWWWLTGKAADITICFGPNASGGMTAVTRDLVAAGCKVASWSWGMAASNWSHPERQGLAQAFADAVTAGCTFCAASGDNSIDDSTDAPTPDYPAADPNVWAVGGTRLSLRPDGSIMRERAWGDGRPGDAGGGGGIDLATLMPGFQNGIVPGTHRGVPDSSANADPVSGWIMSANGHWTVVGGTSASSPFTAALIGVAKASRSLTAGLLTPALYANRAAATRDILVGSNGERAHPGWDQATGNGSPHGPAFIAAL